jgi:gluconate 2-dehydrogenase gamma chain
MNASDTSRRQFLVRASLGLSCGWFSLHWPAIQAAQAYARSAAQSSPAAEFQFFSREAGVEIEAVAAQIIPTDDAPGAREAHVIYFIDRALVTFDKDKQAAYTAGLKQLQLKTEQMFSGASQFSSLSSAQQTELLTAIEKTEFFELVRLHTIMGYLSRPDYGGNHDQAGWKLIGFEEQMTFEPPFGYYDSEENKRG